MAIAYLLLGSNMGDKTSILYKAAEMLQKISINPILLSDLYESEPWGFETDEWFVNQTIKIETDLEPAHLLRNLLEIEKKLGRVRVKGREKTIQYSSRTLDIDILLYDNLIIDTLNLHIPHPKMHLRRFVLMPLCEIAPHAIHSTLKKTIDNLLDECEDKLIVRKK